MPCAIGSASSPGFMSGSWRHDAQSALIVSEVHLKVEAGTYAGSELFYLSEGELVVCVKLAHVVGDHESG